MSESLGLSFFALFYEEFDAIALKKKQREDLIRIYFIPTLMVAKHFISFNFDDPIIAKKENSKKDAQELLIMIEHCIEDFIEPLDEVEIDSLYTKIIEVSNFNKIN